MVKSLSAMVLGLAVFASSAHAQGCSVGYTHADRPVVLEQLPQAIDILNRMTEVASMASTGVLTATQRGYLDLEFQGRIGQLQQFGDLRRRGISARGNRFLNEVIDPTYLNLANLKVSGSTNAEAQVNALGAISAINAANLVMTVCLSGSWQRLQIKGIENDHQCAGGYTRADRRSVLHEVNEAKNILSTLAGVAEASIGATTTFEQILMEFEFEYAREDLDILGMQDHRGISRQTNKFLRTVIDPVYLGLMNKAVTGSTVEEGHANATEALAAVNASLNTLQQCAR